jgi:signal transduction histidine kinase
LEFPGDTGVEFGCGRRGVEVNPDDEVLRQWRRRAADIVIAAGVVLHLPGVILFFSGYSPTDGWPATTTLLTSYGLTVAVALLRHIDHEIRTWVLLGSLWLFTVVGVVVIPQGPYVRALPIVAPVLAIVLIGVGAARIATVISLGVLLFGPFLRLVPGLPGLLGAGEHAHLPLKVISLQGVALTAQMLVLMTLLEAFYRFLLESLAAERRATAERIAAQRRLETEIEQRRRLEHEIARVSDEERRRLGHDVHDGVCQQLTAGLLRCQALELRLERGAPPSFEELGALSCLLGEAIHEARAVAEGLCPIGPAPDALAPALRDLARRAQRMSGVSCEFHAEGDVLLRNAATAQHLYRIAQEALSNAVRHARASRITVDLQGSDEGLHLRVQDNGVGLPGDLRPGGMGLRNMAFRAEVLEGELTVEAAAGGGACVSCRVPRAACFPPGDHQAPVPAGRAT